MTTTKKPKHYSRSSVYGWMGNPLGIAEQMNPGDTIDADALPSEEHWAQFRARLANDGLMLSTGPFTVIKKETPQ